MTHKQLITYFLLIVVLPLSVLGVIAWVYRGSGETQAQRQQQETESSHSESTLQSTSALGNTKPKLNSESGNSESGNSESGKSSKPAAESQPRVQGKETGTSTQVDGATKSVPDLSNGESKPPTKSESTAKPTLPSKETPASTASKPADSMQGDVTSDFEKKVLNVFQSDKGRVIFPDLIEIESDGEKIQFRLESVSTPRRGQPYHDEARQFVEKLVGDSPVAIHKTFESRGRSYGYVVVDGKNVGDELLKAGLAWHYKRASKSERLAEMESTAKKEKKGLWSESAPTPPWEFNRRNRNE